MPKVIFIDADGTRTEAQAQSGATLMQAAVAAGIDAIAAECGGACACGTCHCRIGADWIDRLPPPDAGERDMLDFVIDPGPRSRLSCQVTLAEDHDGLVVDIPSAQV